MSIQIQKWIRFIPVVNLLTMFCWINLCFKKSIKATDYVKELCKMFIFFFIISFIRIACSFTFKNELLDAIVTWISIYLYFLTMSWVAVMHKEKF